MPTLTNFYSIQDLSKHNTKHDCWILVHGKKFSLHVKPVLSMAEHGEISAASFRHGCYLTTLVYDVTQYLDDHPGGDDVILATIGQDATEEFEDAGHSKSARELMEQYYIGELDTSSPVSSKQCCTEKFVQLTKQYWVAPVAVIGISVVVGFLYLRKK